ncbi:MAG: hypothetical protein ACI4GY_01590 [Acutalibacteraceae bacterium]
MKTKKDVETSLDFEKYSDTPQFKIDNAATLYAASRTKKWSRTFRVSLVLDCEIDGEILQKALNSAEKRFPYFFVRLREGLFWSYFERTGEHSKIFKESDYPYRPVSLPDLKEPCFRLLYYKNRISLECFHSLTDGNGAFSFLIAVSEFYVIYAAGNKSEKEEAAFENEIPAKKSEAADSYYEYYNPKFSAKNPSKPQVYLCENESVPGFACLIHGLCEIDNLKAVAKKHSLTITEYLTAALIYTYYSCAEKVPDSPISVSVPIDLRRRFASQSVRNFVFMTDVTFDCKGRDDVRFDEICSTVRGVLAKKSTKEALLPEISANVSAAENKVIKPIPYFIKKAFLRNTYKNVQQSYTGFFSNVGALELPAELSKHVLRADFCLGETPYQHFGCAAVSVVGLMNITFSSGNKNTDRQKFFFRFLAHDGVHLRIESNIAE